MGAYRIAALVLAMLSAIGAWVVVPELRCSVGLRMPAGECRDTGDGRRHPSVPLTPHVDTVVIQTLLPTPPPLPTPPHQTPEVSASGALPIQMIRLLTVMDVEGKSDHELDIMRNEIYARHGRGFDRPDLRRYFGQFDWYQPIYSPRDFELYHRHLLTGIQQSNAEFLRRYQHSRR